MKDKTNSNLVHLKPAMFKYKELELRALRMREVKKHTFIKNN